MIRNLVPRQLLKRVRTTRTLSLCCCLTLPGTKAEGALHLKREPTRSKTLQARNKSKPVPSQGPSAKQEVPHSRQQNLSHQVATNNPGNTGLSENMWFYKRGAQFLKP